MLFFMPCTFLNASGFPPCIVRTGFILNAVAIAAAAFVARVTFYRNYSSKENVLTTLIDEALASSMPHSSVERYRVYFFMGAMFDAAIKWLEGGCRESAEQMADNCRISIEIVCFL